MRNFLCLFSGIIIGILGLYFMISYNNLSSLVQEQNTQLNQLRNEQILQDSLFNDMWDYIPFGSPVKCIEVSSKFGVRKDPFSRRWRHHDGIDFRGNKKDTVYATGSGFIELSKYSGGYGKCVIIDHGGGYKTKYAHLSKLLCKEGEFIKDKTPIGKIGSSGHSTGSHLHYEILKFCKPIDPIHYVFIDTEK